jgi:hypothetical protein
MLHLLACTCCTQMSVFLAAALNSLGMGATLVALSVVALDGWSRGALWGKAYAPAVHAGAALLVSSMHAVPAGFNWCAWLSAAAVKQLLCLASARCLPLKNHAPGALSCCSHRRWAACALAAVWQPWLRSWRSASSTRATLEQSPGSKPAVAAAVWVTCAPAATAEAGTWGCRGGQQLQQQLLGRLKQAAYAHRCEALRPASQTRQTQAY